ncbi:hypothetical protein G4B88_000369 [Cannabis sativa]|uniref:Uncharacterized protein n=1 Tax=Cannabis sativa TaxID=3483 RepID=A0A7J6F648_CANSA|nr:hypothetical protein G4B88_000369 [Cannabis sativa]
MACEAIEVILHRPVFEGSLSMHDIEIERRPYHRSCGCALHNTKDSSTVACTHHRNISFPKRNPSINSSLLTLSSTSSSSSKFSSQNSSLISNFHVNHDCRRHQ